MDRSEAVALRAQVAQRAEQDPEFRSALVADPVGTLRQEYNVELPDSIDAATFKARVESRFGTGASDQLSNAELEQVAGGKVECSSACACG